MTNGSSCSILTVSFPAAIEQRRNTPGCDSIWRLCPERMTSTLKLASLHTWISLPDARNDLEKAMSDDVQGQLQVANESRLGTSSLSGLAEVLERIRPGAFSQGSMERILVVDIPAAVSDVA